MFIWKWHYDTDVGRRSQSSMPFFYWHEALIGFARDRNNRDSLSVCVTCINCDLCLNINPRRPKGVVTTPCIFVNLPFFHKTKEWEGLLAQLRKRKLSMYGHWKRRSDSLVQMTVEGEVEGKPRPGCRKTGWIDNIRKWTEGGMVVAREKAHKRMPTVLWGLWQYSSSQEWEMALCNHY